MQGQPASTDHLKLKHSAAESLKWDLREAMADNDYARVKQIVMAPDCPAQIKTSALEAAAASGSLMMVRIVFDEAKPDLTPEQAMMLLLVAGERQSPEICAYLCERNANMGIVRGDSYNVIFNKFSEEKISDAVDALLKAAPDRQVALDTMLRAAVGEKKYAAMSGLIDRGAKLGEAAADILSKVTIAVNNDPFYQRKDDYLALVDKCASITPKGYLTDCFAGVSGMMASANMQYNETPEIFLRHGADPFYGLKSTSLDKHLPPESPLRVIFGRYEESYTAQQRSAFREMFGTSYTVADLRREVDAEGTTGLMLAAKARLLPEVMGKDGLTSQDMLHSNQRQQTLIQLAAQRGDGDALLDATYWRRAEPAILATLQKELPDAVKQYLDLGAFAAALDRAALKEQAVRFKLGARPKP
ncbi:MAG: hypothetical protein ACAH80_04860 [Alphaproteobacteria bacterium]